MARQETPVTNYLSRPIEVSYPFPKAPETRIHLHVTIQSTSLLLFLTTTLNGDTSGATPMGSFVYALPDVSSIYISHLSNENLIVE
jgi:hypothetical protein